MAFKLDIGQFFAGGADVIVQKVKAEEAQAREDESWDRKHQKQQDAIDNRTRGDRRRADERNAKELAEKLSVFFTPGQTKDIMSKGNAHAEHAIARGAYYDGKGLDASTMYTMPDNDIINTGAGALNIDGEPPVGMGGSFAGQFKRVAPTKEAKTQAEYELNLLNDRIAAGDDAEKIEKIDLRQSELLKLIAAKAKAAREAEDPDAKIEFYTIEQREKKVERTRMLAQSELKLKIGSLGEGVLQGKLKGTNALPFAELLTAQKLFIDNNAGYKEEQMYKSINGIVDNAKRSFNQYVESNSNKILGANTFSSKEDLRNAIKTGGRLKVGDMYAFLQPASTKTVDGVEVSTPEAYVAGTYLGSAYRTDLKIEDLLNATYLPPSWKPVEPDL